MFRITLLLLTATNLGAQGTRGIQSGTRPARFVIRNAMVVIGNGTPASGPYDIVIEGNTIADVVALDPALSFTTLPRSSGACPEAAIGVHRTALARRILRPAEAIDNLRMKPWLRFENRRGYTPEEFEFPSPGHPHATVLPGRCCVDLETFVIAKLPLP